MSNLNIFPSFESKRQKRDRSFAVFGKVPPLFGLNRLEESMSTSTGESARSELLVTSKSDETYNHIKVKSQKNVSSSLPTTPNKESFNKDSFIKANLKDMLQKQSCPICNDNKNVHIVDYWKERKELIFRCSNIFEKYITSNTINVDLGFKICAYMWTSTQLKPLCVCDSHMRIECHYNNYYYVCLQCKSLSHSTKEEN